MYSNIFAKPLLSKTGLVSTQVFLNNQQKTYILFIITSKIFSIKNILLISFRKGDKNTQPKDQLKNILL